METVLGEQDAFAEQLVGEGFDRLGVDTPFRAEAGRAVADERAGDDTGQPAGLEDLGEPGIDAAAVLAGFPAGEALSQVAEPAPGDRTPCREISRTRCSRYLRVLPLTNNESAVAS